MTFPLMALGGKGVISVVSNLVPDRMSTMVKHMLDGEVEKARNIHFEMFELCQAMFIETNPIPVKGSPGAHGNDRTRISAPSLCTGSG
jgi:4-hydroxy-tetrahydrodipicolinate synthase